MKQGTRTAVISASFPPAFIFVCLVSLFLSWLVVLPKSVMLILLNHNIHNTIIVLKIDKTSLFPLIIFIDRGFNALSSPEQKTVKF